MDKILLKDLEFFAYHGVFQEERDNGQIFRVSIEMGKDLKPAGQSDDLVLTIDYSKVYDTIRKIMLDEQHQLIETLAERIASDVLAKFDINNIRVTVDKPFVQYDNGSMHSAVIIERSRCNE